MKKKVLAAVLMGAMVFSMAACGSNGGDSESGSSDGGSEASAPSGTISVLSREEGSGTRGAFVELFGVEEENADGEKVDNTTVDAQVTNSTAVMMTTVAGDPQAIGYISLGSLDDSVKALKVDGADATAENVKNGTYKVSRPFNIVTNDDLSDVAQDFIDYILSSDGQAIVEKENYIAVDDAAEAYAGSSPEGNVVVAGSSSVTPVMEKLKEGYEAVNPNASIEIQQSDSTTGVEQAISGVCDIGMASRELKDEEAAELEGTVIATDGIAVIVNKNNPTDDLTSDQVKNIYLGDVTTWDAI